MIETMAALKFLWENKVKIIKQERRGKKKKLRQGKNVMESRA